MNNSQPFSLRIFVADGEPDGLRIVERSSNFQTGNCSIIGSV
jgi:hypothetical protein